MWWSFRKTKKVGKRGRVTASKSGLSASYGVKGARISVGKKGGRATFKLLGIRFGGKLW
jgi:hypothetical protein